MSTDNSSFEIQNRELYDKILADFTQKETIKITSMKRKALEIHYETWLNMIWKRIRKYQAIVLMYVGFKGSGKSYAAIIDALGVDPLFTLKQVIFSKDEAEEQFEILRESKTKHPEIPRVVIWDEVGIGLHNREWYQKEQIQIIKKLLAIRTTGINVFCCVPHLRYADSSLDGQINYMIEMIEPQENNPVRFGKILKPFGFLSERKPLKFIPVPSWDGKRFHAPYLDPSKQHPLLFKQYEVLRTEYAYKLLERDQREQSSVIKLTPREMEYLHLFIRDHSISVIAKELHVSTTAVDKMKRKLRDKGALAPVEA